MPVDETGKETYFVLVIETPYVISFSTIEELDVEHVIIGLMGTFHYTVD